MYSGLYGKEQKPSKEQFIAYYKRAFLPLPHFLKQGRKHLKTLTLNGKRYIQTLYLSFHSSFLNKYYQHQDSVLGDKQVTNQTFYFTKIKNPFLWTEKMIGKLRQENDLTYL